MDYLVDGGCDCARHRLSDQIVAGLARYGCPTIKNLAIMKSTQHC